MITAAYFILSVVLGAVLYFGIRWLVKACSKYRGTRAVDCPEMGRPALAEIDVLHASLTSVNGPPDIRLENCSRWSLNNQCGQGCLANLDVAPGECLVSGVLMRWYRGKNCVYCGKPAEELQWMDHAPALQTLAGEPREVPVENHSVVLKTHLPVCWNCYIAQSFRKEHPDLWSFNDQGGIAFPETRTASPASRHL